MKKHRIQFDFTTDRVEALDSLVAATDATSRAEVVRDALALYRHLGPALLAGHEVYIRGPDGRETRILLAR